MLFASRSSAFSRSSSRLLSSPCGERRKKDSSIILASQFQSTLPVRGATARDARTHGGRLISIHAPRAGSDISFSFLLTGKIYFNPRSPCGERQFCIVYVGVLYEISIHAPRAGSDRVLAQMEAEEQKFQSTLPVRGATSFDRGEDFAASISIHAPRAGSDPRRTAARVARENFNPRSPCGERRD